MNVESILKAKGRDVATIAEDRPIADAVELLNSHGIGALVVIDSDGAVIGILSERDIVRHLGEHPGAVLEQLVASAMTRDVLTCEPDTGIADLMERMTRHRIRHIPVVSGKKLIGIISIGDVVKRKIEDAEKEAEHLRDYIAS